MNLAETVRRIAATTPSTPVNIPTEERVQPPPKTEGPYGPCDSMPARRAVVAVNPALVSMAGEHRASLVAQVRTHLLQKRELFQAHFAKALGNGRIPTLLAWKQEELSSVQQRFLEMIEDDDVMMAALCWMSERTNRQWSISQITTCIITLIGFMALSESVGSCIPRLDVPAAPVAPAKQPKATKAPTATPAPSATP